MEFVLHVHKVGLLFETTVHKAIFGALLVFLLLGTCLAGAEEGKTSIYHEAPAFSYLVKSGILPQVDDRLPLNPMLVQPIERIGIYGGTWFRAIKKTRDHASFIRTIGYENLVRWDPWWINVVPNIAERFEVDDKASEFTFFLRKGLRWSDGQPFTADDILFWYEDVLLNRELTPSIPAWLTSGGKRVKVVKKSDSVVTFQFEVPNGLFLMNLASPWGGEPTEYPSHYLKKFHPRYNTNNLNDLIADAGVKNWSELFRLKAGEEIDDPSRWQNPDLPRLYAWIIKNHYTPDAKKIIAERNPYYWKIDPAGNQLPYIDRVVYELFGDTDELVKIIDQGMINMQTRHIPQAKVRKKKNTFSLVSSFSNTEVISLNLTHKDPILRKIFSNKNFRIGLSHAIDRNYIIQKVFSGDGEPFQAAPKIESPFFNKRLAKQYTEYNVSLANEYLDKAGCTERDDEGFRLRPDGKRIHITLDVIDFLSMLEVARFIPEYWRNVGIDTHLDIMEREDLYRQKKANEHDAVAWVGDGGLAVLLEPRWYFPSSPVESNFAIPWARWFVNEKDPEAQIPPKEVRQQMKLYSKILTIADQKIQADIMRKILDIAVEQFYVIGISIPPLRYGILDEGFKNVPGFMAHSWAYPHPAPTNPCQYFIEE